MYIVHIGTFVILFFSSVESVDAFTTAHSVIHPQLSYHTTCRRWAGWTWAVQQWMLERRSCLVCGCWDGDCNVVAQCAAVETVIAMLLLSSRRKWKVQFSCCADTFMKRWIIVHKPSTATALLWCLMWDATRLLTALFSITWCHLPKVCIAVCMLGDSM